MSPIAKRKRTKFSIPSKYLLLLLTFACILLMAVTFFTDYSATPLNKLVGYVIVPFQNGVSRIGAWISVRVDELGELRVVLQENQELKQKVDELTVQNTQLQQDKYELNNLRELYKLDEQYSGYEKVGARIIARDSGNWFHSFIINKGSDDGLAMDMNVIAGGGLVGRIVDIGTNWSKVNAIINDNSNVSGMVLASSDILMVKGSLELMADGVIGFEQLTDSADKVQVGDKVVTSNISDKYLPSILIGYITEINPDSNNITKSGKITPAVDFEHLEEVLVITKTKQQIAD
ncbi:rod shape-determining protein MreC [Lachnospiraceae bacterium MD335]|nr:rod shape-determining protein MreC [Lachnospiraceae bacterium MD335]NDO50078.1 rod shape-determining protein MreC [Lachnospiraceae bacterium MD335]